MATGRKRERGTRHLWVLPLLAVVLFIHGMLRPELTSGEAAVSEAACRAFLDNTTVGRQALVSSAWWPPLPVLMRLPCAAAIPLQDFPVASLLVSAIFGTASLFLLTCILREWGIGGPRFLFAGALLLHPAFLAASGDGSSTTAVLFLMLLVLRGLVQWASLRQARYLVYLGVGAALLAGTSFEMGPWLLLVMALFLVDTMTAGFPAGRREAVLLLGLLPAAYLAGLWFLMNWLVMGDPLYFVRPLFTERAQSFVADPGGLRLTRLDYGVGGCCLLVFLVAGLRGDRSGVFTGILGTGIVGAGFFLASRRLFWEPEPLLVCLVPLCSVAAGALCRLLSAGRWGQVALSCVPIALTVLSSMGFGREPRPGVTARSAGTLLEQAHERRRMVESHVRAASAFPKVFVCGYEGFHFLWNNRSGVFVHAMDFDFFQTKEDYYGQHLYVLVHRPSGRSTMDSIHRKYPRIFEFGADSSLYDKTWGDWRLFEVIQAPKK